MYQKMIVELLLPTMTTLNPIYYRLGIVLALLISGDNVEVGLWSAKNGVFQQVEKYFRFHGAKHLRQTATTCRLKKI